MRIEEATALVTGANRGIGREITEALLERGAKKVYAGVRRPDSVADLAERHGNRLLPLKLDITAAQDVASAAEQAGDVNLLVNNAGVLYHTTGLGEDELEKARSEMEVNYFGLLRMARAFAPVLQRNGGGTMVNLDSIASHVAFPMLTTYSATKAAAHSLTQSLRAHLADRGTTVIGVYPGPIETDMTEGLEFEKTPPEEVAKAVLDAVVSGEEDVFPDAMAQDLYAQFREDPKALEQQAAQMSA